MAFKFPYGAMQQLNLDWFIKQFQKLRADWATAEENIAGSLQDEIDRAEDALSDVFSARDTAVAAKDDAVQAKADALQASANAAQYWQNAANSAGSAAGSAGTALQAAEDAETAESNAAASNTQSGVNKFMAEAWAVGTMNGTPVGSGTIQYNNNAKYYAQQASGDAAQTALDRAAVAQDKDDTDTIKDNANAAALRAEGWADGTQNGTPVTSESPYYENNAKYYKEAAEDVLDSIPPDYSDLADEVASQSEKINEQIALEDYKIGYSFASGGIDSTGKAVTNTARIRTTGNWLINVCENDTLMIAAPYSFKASFYNKSLSAANFIYQESSYVRYYKVPSTYIGKCIALEIKNDNTPSANISGQISDAKNAFNYWRTSGIVDSLESTQNSVFKYTETNYSFYEGQRLDPSTGGSSANSYVIGTESYLECNKDNPIFLEISGNAVCDVFFYTSASQNNYQEHTGFFTQSTIFDGSYNGINYSVIRFNVRNNTFTQYEDASALTAQVKVKRLTPFMPGSPSGTSAINKRFTVKVNLNWPDVNSTATNTQETDTDTDILCILRLPSSYSQTGKPTPLIMFGHGASAQITSDMWYSTSSNFAALIDAFSDAGYAVFDVNNTRNASGGFPDWGSLPLMSAYIKAWEYIKENYNVEHRLYLFSDSMGTCANLNMLKWYGSEIVTSIMTAPRPICKTRYEDLTGTSKTNFETSFGITTGAWEDRLNGFNHYENIVTIDNKSYVFEKFPPVKVMVGQSDTGFLTETRAYYAALANNGNYVNYREVEGADHSKMSFLSDSALRAEAIAWFDRFRYQETT